MHEDTVFSKMQSRSSASKTTLTTSKNEGRITTELQEEFIAMTPTKDFSDWCRFMDRHPELLDDQNDANIYANAAVKALETRSENRAKFCIEKSVFLTFVGGKKLRERDKFFDRFHEGEKKTMDAFVQRFRSIEERCRGKILSAPPTSHPPRLPDGETGIRDIGQALNDLGLRHNAAAKLNRRATDFSATDPKSRHTAATERDKEYSESRQPQREADRHHNVPSQEPNKSHGPPISMPDGATTNLEPSIKGTKNNTATFETLDQRYQRRDPKRAGAFFKVGRVFAILEHLEDGRNDDRTSDAKWRTRKGNIVILSHIRRFAVVREGHGYCWAVPINTYNGHGLRKIGFNDGDVQAHAIIYDSQSKPYLLKNEPRPSKLPIAVVCSDDAEPLTHDSRINFAKVTTVEHNVRAMSVGKVSSHSLTSFMNYWKQHLLE